jgi:hypothetical protein
VRSLPSSPRYNRCLTKNTKTWSRMRTTATCTRVEFSRAELSKWLNYICVKTPTSNTSANWKSISATFDLESWRNQINAPSASLLTKLAFGFGFNCSLPMIYTTPSLFAFSSASSFWRVISSCWPKGLLSIPSPPMKNLRRRSCISWLRFCVTTCSLKPWRTWTWKQFGTSVRMILYLSSSSTCVGPYISIATG